MRRATGLLLVGVSVALGACNGTLRQAHLPPFPTIGNWSSTQWRTIAPTLGGRLNPNSSNICNSGRPACMDAIVGEMGKRITALGCSHLAPFAAMYRQVSAEVRASVYARRYVHPAYVTYLDAVFATFYFRALDSWRARRRDGVPRPWRMAFSAGQNRRVSTFGDILLGMNAHISRDLPYALASVGLRFPDGRDAATDVTAVNEDIARAEQPILAAIRARYDPAVGPPRDLPRWLQPSEVPRIIAQWRLEAIANARDLLAAHTVAEGVQIETRVDATAALRALLIWRATAYDDPVRDRASRDGYCTARS